MFELENKDDPAKSGQVTSRKGTEVLDPMENYDFGGAPTKKVSRLNDKGQNLDDGKHEAIFNNLMGHYRMELDRQHDNRSEMAMDEDFYDGDQWSDEDKEVLASRGQAALVYNVISTTVNWMLGTERRGRTDYKILPRDEEGAKAAERKSQILKYLSDVNMSEFHSSRAFKDQVVVGLGWIESGLQPEDDGLEPIYDRYESWRNILHDSMATELDLSDGRYIFRSKWLDTDIAKAMFKDRSYTIERSATTSIELLRALDGTGDEHMDAAEEEWSQSIISGDGANVSERARVRLVEAWFRTPTEDRYMRGGQFTGELFDPRSRGHMADVERGRATVVPRVTMRMHVAIMCDAGLLFLAKSPYRHNAFPFTPLWCYRRGRNNLPYGVVRSMRGPQEDINKRASKALHILSSNKVIMDKGAVDDLDAFEEEMARPDGILVKNKGKQLEIAVDRELAPAHLDLMSRSISMIQQLSGITDESLGRTTNATSGKAIIARQDQGALATAPIFDNLRMARQTHGGKMLSLMEQYMSEEKRVRITNMRGNPEFISANDGLPENDLISTKADFIVSEDEWKATMREAQMESLFDLASQIAPTNPEFFAVIADLIVEMMDIPNRDEIVKRIRQVTGQTDPDADPNNPDPETLAMQQGKQKQAEMAERMAMAELAGKEAEAKQKMAQAEKAGIEAAKLMAEIRQVLAKTAGANVETQVKALEAAAAIMSAAPLSNVADTVLAEAGYQPQPAQAGAPAAPAPAPAQPPQPVPQPQPQQQPVPQQMQPAPQQQPNI